VVTSRARRFYVFHYVPDVVLPLFVFAVGRRQCCGARWSAPHLAGCPKTSERGDASHDENYGGDEHDRGEAVAEPPSPHDPLLLAAHQEADGSRDTVNRR
jgi:hypothetical protein